MALVKAAEEANLNAGDGGGGTHVRGVDTTSMARKYHNMVLGGKVRAAVHTVMNRDGGGAYGPFDLASKSGNPVIDVLQERHPTSCVQSEEDFNDRPDTSDRLDLMPVYCFKECVHKAASCLSGGTGPCGVETDMLKNWLLHHGVQSEHLCEVIAMRVDWLSNGSPPLCCLPCCQHCSHCHPGQKPRGTPIGD